MSDPPITFRPRPDFPLLTDIWVGRPGSMSRFDASSSVVVVPQGNAVCSGDRSSGEVSTESTLCSDNAECFADGRPTAQVMQQINVLQFLWSASWSQKRAKYGKWSLNFDCQQKCFTCVTQTRVQNFTKISSQLFQWYNRKKYDEKTKAQIESDAYNDSTFFRQRSYHAHFDIWAKTLNTF